MSDSYHYEDGAKHYDHKKVLHIDKLQGADLQQLMRAFFKDDAEEADVVEELKDEETDDKLHKDSIDEATENIDDNEESELNFATPRIVLQNMLKAEKVRPVFNNPKKYTKEWTDQFVASLIASKHGAYIAKKWEENDQRNLLKGYIFGLLAASGVLKGSKLSIARSYLEISAKSKVPELVKQVNTFASYMSKSRWKNEPYADWVLEYIGEPQEEA